MLEYFQKYINGEFKKDLNNIYDIISNDYEKNDILKKQREEKKIVNGQSIREQLYDFQKANNIEESNDLVKYYEIVHGDKKPIEQYITPDGRIQKQKPYNKLKRRGKALERQKQRENDVNILNKKLYYNDIFYGPP